MQSKSISYRNKWGK